MYVDIVELNDKDTATALERQVLDPASRYYGGIVDPHTGIPRPSHVGTAANVTGFTASLLNPESRFFHSKDLLQRLDIAMDFMLRHQHEDGTITLGSTNYHSPPDTAFVINLFALVNESLVRSPWDAISGIKEKVTRFLERTIPPMATGGGHTPNHRWVMTSALAWLHRIFQRPELLARAQQWLAEGMDCTEDGEWTERSNGIYNAVSDLALYYAGVLLDRPELLDYVRRNLRMMMYLVHPDGTVVTEYSGRQDVGQRFTIGNYQYVYRLMAAHDQDPQFASMADLSSQYANRSGVENNPAMVLGCMLKPSILLEGMERQALPVQYEMIINEQHPMNDDLSHMDQVGHHGRVHHTRLHTAFGAPVVRFRHHDTSATIMVRNPLVFALHHGGVGLLGVKVSTSFTPGIVDMDSLEKDGDVYRLKATMEKGYNGPIPEEFLPALREDNISPWYLLPHQHRPITHLQRHEVRAEIKHQENHWSLRVVSNDHEDVFTQVSFLFAQDVSIDGPDIKPIDEFASFWTAGSLRASVGGDTMELNSGAHDHWIPVVRDDAIARGVKTVVVNLMTPFDKVFDIYLS